MTEINVEVNGNSTLLDIAKNNLKAYRGLEAIYPNDDGVINIKGYLLQQTIELALKHRLETNGIAYTKTHDIEKLLDLQPEEDAFPELRPWSGTITILEAKTRYLKNYNVSAKTVYSVNKLANDLIKFIENEELIEKIKNQEFIDAYSQYNVKDKPIKFMQEVVKIHGTDTNTFNLAIEAVVECENESPTFKAKLLNDVMKSEEYQQIFDKEHDIVSEKTKNPPK